MQPSDIWFLEHSCSQAAFHIQPLQNAILSNLKAFRDRRANDYVPLAAGTRQEMVEGVESLMALQSEREEFEQSNRRSE
jgi:hypothetical protein